MRWLSCACQQCTNPHTEPHARHVGHSTVLHSQRRLRDCLKRRTRHSVLHEKLLAESSLRASACPHCRAHNVRVNEEVVVRFKSLSWLPRRASPRPVARQRRSPGSRRAAPVATWRQQTTQSTARDRESQCVRELRPRDQVPFLYDFILLWHAHTTHTSCTVRMAS